MWASPCANRIKESPAIAKLVWALGAALMGTVVNFFSVSYFDQIEVVLVHVAGIDFAVATRLTSCMSGQSWRLTRKTEEHGAMEGE